MGIAAYMLAVIVNTSSFHTSGCQSAPLSDTLLCWTKDCLSAFGVLIAAEVCFMDLQCIPGHISLENKCSTNKLTHSLSWRGDMPVSGSAEVCYD